MFLLENHSQRYKSATKHEQQEYHSNSAFDQQSDSDTPLPKRQDTEAASVAEPPNLRHWIQFTVVLCMSCSHALSHSTSCCSCFAQKLTVATKASSEVRSSVTDRLYSRHHHTL